MNRRSLVGLLLVVLLSVPTRSQGPPKPKTQAIPDFSFRKPTVREIAKDAIAATVAIVAQYPDGSERYGSGFYVGDELVATCAHVVATSTRIVVTSVAVGDAHGDVYLMGIDRAADLALLRVPCYRHKHPKLILGDSLRVDVGDTIYVVSNPRGYEATFSAGTLSALRNDGRRDILQITAPVSPGSSGAPIIDEIGLVVGVVTSSQPNAQNLNFGAVAESLCLLGKSNNTGLLCLRITPEEFFENSPKQRAKRKTKRTTGPG